MKTREEIEAQIKKYLDIATRAEVAGWFEAAEAYFSYAEAWQWVIEDEK